MAARNPQHGVALSVECLEARELLAAALSTPSVLSKETFDGTLPGLLPKGWSQSSTPGSFGGAPARGYNRSIGLASDGVSSQNARAWSNAFLPADVRASANVFLDSTKLIPAQVFVRGNSLDTNTPSFYAAGVTRGLSLELTRVVNGQRYILARLNSTAARYISNQWVRVTLQAQGSRLTVQVRRLDTNEYLNSNGMWQKEAVTAISFNDAKTASNPQAFSSAGFVGVNRASGYPGSVVFDEFQASGLTTSSASVNQTFNYIGSGALPPDWSQWSDDGPFSVSTVKPLSSTGGLLASGTPRTNSRIWMDAPAPANSQVSASIFLNSLSGASVLLRGNNLSSSKPTYYAATVTKGMRVALTRVVAGSALGLGRAVQTTSAGYISNQWVRLSLAANGNNLQVQVQRLDTRQYLTPTGLWQAAPTAAINVTDSVSLPGGKAGVARTNATSDNIAFDDFQVTTVASQPISVRIVAPPDGALVQATTNVQVAVTSPSSEERRVGKECQAR